MISASGSITSHQLKHLVSNPVDLIPSQGVGKVIIVVSCVSRMIYGGSDAFQDNGGDGIQLTYGPQPIFQICPVMGSQSITAQSDQFAVNTSNANSSAGYAFSNSAGVYLNKLSGVNLSGNGSNDNTLSWQIEYYIITI